MIARSWFFTITIDGSPYGVRIEKDYPDHSDRPVYRWNARHGTTHVADGTVSGVSCVWEARESVEAALFQALSRPFKDIMARLEALTPGGSEFHRDPYRCLTHIEARRNEAVEQALLRARAERRVKKLEAACKAALDYLTEPGDDVGPVAQYKALTSQLRDALYLKEASGD